MIEHGISFAYSSFLTSNIIFSSIQLERTCFDHDLKLPRMSEFKEIAIMDLFEKGDMKCSTIFSLLKMTREIETVRKGNGREKKENDQPIPGRIHSNN